MNQLVVQKLEHRDQRSIADDLRYGGFIILEDHLCDERVDLIAVGGMWQRFLIGELMNDMFLFGGPLHELIV